MHCSFFCQHCTISSHGCPYYTSLCELEKAKICGQHFGIYRTKLISKSQYYFLEVNLRKISQPLMPKSTQLIQNHSLIKSVQCILINEEICVINAFSSHTKDMKIVDLFGTIHTFESCWCQKQTFSSQHKQPFLKLENIFKIDPLSSQCFSFFLNLGFLLINILALPNIGYIPL